MTKRQGWLRPTDGARHAVSIRRSSVPSGSGVVRKRLISRRHVKRSWRRARKASSKSGSTLIFRRVFDRVKPVVLEPEEIPRLQHMWRQRRGGVDHTAPRMRDDDAAREEMQAVLQSTGQLPVLDVEVFG